MLKYRVLNLSKNKFLDESKLSLRPDGSLKVNPFMVPALIDIQEYIHLIDKNETDIFIGDALSIKLNQNKYDKQHIDQLLQNNHFTYLPDNYDEIIIQITKDNIDLMFYWVMFKLDGEFIKNKDCNFPTENEEYAHEVRAIPTDSISLLGKLSRNKTFEVSYNCTDSRWVKIV
jgi:hypothetical protein